MNHRTSLSILILAAGKGTRMKSEKAKVLHELFYSPMIHHVLKGIEPLKPQQTIVIVGHQQQAVEDSLAGFDVEFALQKEQLGTGHAVLCTEKYIHPDCESVMILCGDTPLIRSELLEQMVQHHYKNSATLTVMTTLLDDPTHYGRIVCDYLGRVQAIVEEKDANDEQREIKEINTGIFCVQREFLFKALKQVDNKNSQGEIYLTDILSLAVNNSLDVEKFYNPNSQDILGVNSRVELAQAHMELQRRRNHDLMIQGVSMVDPNSISIDERAVIGSDTVVSPGVHIRGKTSIGTDCLLENGVILNNCTIGNHVRIGAYSCLDSQTVEDKTTLAPYTSTVKK